MQGGRSTVDRQQRNQGISGDHLFMDNDLYIDGEERDKSSWCRFMNHVSKSKTNACNVETRCTRPQRGGMKGKFCNREVVVHGL
jgi:hypothetical protein